MTSPLTSASSGPGESLKAHSHEPSICIVDGYGLRIAIERRHLVVVDGTGRGRRERRFPRVGHGLRRLVVLGHSGSITLEFAAPEKLKVMSNGKLLAERTGGITDHWNDEYFRREGERLYVTVVPNTTIVFQ